MTDSDQRRRISRDIVNLDVRLIKAVDRVSRAVDDSTFSLVTVEIGRMRAERAAKRLELESM
jgi:hypothetical protein